MYLYVYDCVIHWDVHVGYSGSRCCAHNFGTAGCRTNEFCVGMGIAWVFSDTGATPILLKRYWCLNRYFFFLKHKATIDDIKERLFLLPRQFFFFKLNNIL